MADQQKNNIFHVHIKRLLKHDGSRLQLIYWMTVQPKKRKKALYILVNVQYDKSVFKDDLLLWNSKIQ